MQQIFYNPLSADATLAAQIARRAFGLPGESLVPAVDRLAVELATLRFDHSNFWVVGIPLQQFDYLVYSQSPEFLWVDNRWDSDFVLGLLNNPWQALVDPRQSLSWLAWHRVHDVPPPDWLQHLRHGTARDLLRDLSGRAVEYALESLPLATDWALQLLELPLASEEWTDLLAAGSHQERLVAARTSLAARHQSTPFFVTRSAGSAPACAVNTDYLLLEEQAVALFSHSQRLSLAWTQLTPETVAGVAVCQNREDPEYRRLASLVHQDSPQYDNFHFHCPAHRFGSRLHDC